MGRKFTLMLLFLLSLGLVQAQNNLSRNASKGVIYTESFDTWPPANWELTAAAGDGFIQGTAYVGEGGAYHKYAFDDCDSWMVSPAIDIEDNYVLEFFQKNAYVADWYGYHGLCISTGSNDPASGDFVEIMELNEVAAEFEKIQVELDDYAGEQVYIAFHYTGNNASDWYVDEFTVVLPDQYDIALDLEGYSFVHCPGDYTPKVKAVQLGYDQMVDIEIAVLVNDVEIETKTITVDGYTSVEVEFTPINIIEASTIKFEATYDGDANPDNNVVEKEMLVIPEATAYAYGIYYDDANIPFGPVTFTVDNSQELTHLEHASADDLMASGGTMVNDMWLVNMVYSVEESKSLKNKRKEPVQSSKGFVPAKWAFIDVETGEHFNMYPSAHAFQNIAYNPVDDMVYCIYKDGDNTKVYVLDYRTGELTENPNANTTIGNIAALAINNDGDAYAICWDKKLYSVDLTTVEFTEIGDLGVEDIGWTQSAAFDLENDILYWSLCNSNDGMFYTIDTETGAAQLITRNIENAEFSALGFINGDPMLYTAFEVVNEGDAPLKNVEVTVDGKTIKTDVYGKVAFCDLVEGQTYDYTMTYEEVTATGSFVMDENKKIAVQLAVAPPVYPDAYARLVSQWDDNYVQGIVTYNFGDPNSVTNLSYGEKDGRTSFAGTMVNGLYITNILQSTSDERGPVSLERQRGMNPMCIAVVDTETGEYYNIASTNAYCTDMAYNPVDGKVYGVNNTEAGFELITIDYITGATEVVGLAPADAPALFTLAISLEGDAYSASTDGNLYKIDLTDFSYELVGPLGTVAPAYVQSMEFNHEDGKLYWNMYSSPKAAACIIDPETGAAEEIFQWEQKMEFTALAFEYGEPKFYAAIKVVDLDGDPVQNAEVTCDGMTRPTDDYGYVAFTDLELDEEYEYSVAKEEFTVSGVFTLEGNEVIEVEISTEPIVYPDAFGYIVVSYDQSIPNGPMNYNLGDVSVINPLPYGEQGNLTSFGGTFAEDVYIINMLLSTQDRNGFYPIRRNRAVTPVCLAALDMETGEHYTIAETPSLYAIDMAYNPVDGKVYAVDAFTDDLKLVAVDIKTAEVTEIGIFPASASIFTIGITSEGEAYGITISGDLYKINLTDCSVELVGSTNVPNIAAYVQSIEIDQNTDRLFWNMFGSASGNSFAKLIEVDLETAAATVVDDFPLALEITGLGIKAVNEPINYAAFKIMKAGSIMPGIDVKVDGRTLTTDDKGQVAFVDIEMAEHTVECIIDGQTYTETVVVNESGLYEVALVGLDEINSQLGIYPNPTTGVINISGIDNIINVQLIDLNGRVVLSDNASDNTINIESLAKGVYNIRVFTNESVANQKVILK